MYDLLQGIRVLDVSLLAPTALGMELADLGAEVIKIEAPPHGDYVRAVGGPFRGGPSLLHLRWNRSKKSCALNLKSPKGRDVFLELAAKSQVVIEGLRYGAMDRFGTGYEAVRQVNPSIVYCAISGVGHSGPYRNLATHGVAFDAFAGVAPVAFREDGMPYIGLHVSIGTRIAPVYAALGIAAALVKALRTGQGTYLDVAETDTAVLVQGDDLGRFLNTGRLQPAPFKNAVRYQYYRTKDNKYVIFQPFEQKFWENFCNALGRWDLLDRQGEKGRPKGVGLDAGYGDEELRAEIAKIMAARTQAEWVSFFIEHNIPGGPVHTLEEVVEDPQFQARENLMAHTHPECGTLKMTTTPLKVGGQRFEATPAPSVGQHTDEVLGRLLGFDQARLDELRRSGVIM